MVLSRLRSTVRYGIPLISIFVLSTVISNAQRLLEGGDRVAGVLLPGDEAALSSPESRTDLPCSVKPIKPELGFDLRFHSGYMVRLSLGPLAGSGTTLRLLFRVTADGENTKPRYFYDRVRVPPIDEAAAGEVHLYGDVDVGVGSYRVDWLMRDGIDRICSSHWEFSASLPAKDRSMPLMIAPGQAIASGANISRNPPVAADRFTNSQPWRVAVIVNFVSVDFHNGDARIARPGPLLGILRTIANDSRTGIVSVTAIDIPGEKILYRETGSTGLDLTGFVKSFKDKSLMTVDVRQLVRGSDERDFLREVIADEMRESRPNAIVLVSPRLVDNSTVGGSQVADVSDDVAHQIFYLSVEPDHVDNSWPDLLATAIRKRKGLVYDIRRPRDLLYAWADVIKRMAD
jgi:hypothetical protein